MTHTLKTHPEFYQDVLEGKKTFEIRRFDRNFKIGDRLILQEYNVGRNSYTGRELDVTVTYILRGNFELFGLASDHCCMVIEKTASK